MTEPVEDTENERNFPPRWLSTDPRSANEVHEATVGKRKILKNLTAG